ncbi:MAG: hypothetical protein CSA50_07315 [Gammaproteobacteria bacterium]|nr:MAG: hypothetical protein CSA50_07315 [Gammaproteobacteria bacterium]
MTIRYTALSYALLAAFAIDTHAGGKPGEQAEEGIGKESTDYALFTTKLMDYALIDNAYKANTLASELTLGTYISDYVTVEGRAGWGYGKDQATPGLDVGIVYWLSWYMGLAYPITEYSTVHGKFGFSHVQADTSRDNSNKKFKDIPKDFLQSTFSMSWAISGDLAITDDLYVTAEYGRLHNDTTTGVKTTHCGLGILYEF